MHNDKCVSAKQESKVEHCASIQASKSSHFLIPLSQAGPFYSEYYEKENIMAVSATGNLCHKNKYLFQFSLQLA